MKDNMEKRLAYIILDIVAIIAILGIVLLADLSEQKDRTTLQKLILGDAVRPFDIMPTQVSKYVPGYYPGYTPWRVDEHTGSCAAIKCISDKNATEIGTAHLFNLAVCACPNGDVYQITRMKYYYSGLPITNYTFRNYTRRNQPIKRYAIPP